MDFDVLQEKYPTQLVVSLSLEKIKENGLPQSDYNSSLEEFDIFVVEYFDEKSNGLCVLVETYYGKRHFYLYASESTDIKTFQKEIATKFSQHKIEYEIKPDAGWSFIRRYTKEILSNG